MISTRNMVMALAVACVAPGCVAETFEADVAGGIQAVSAGKTTLAQMGKAPGEAQKSPIVLPPDDPFAIGEGVIGKFRVGMPMDEALRAFNGIEGVIVKASQVSFGYRVGGSRRGTMLTVYVGDEEVISAHTTDQGAIRIMCAVSPKATLHTTYGGISIGDSVEIIKRSFGVGPSQWGGDKYHSVDLRYGIQFQIDNSGYKIKKICTW